MRFYFNLHLVRQVRRFFRKKAIFSTYIFICLTAIVTFIVRDVVCFHVCHIHADKVDNINLYLVVFYLSILTRHPESDWMRNKPAKS